MANNMLYVLIDNYYFEGYITDRNTLDKYIAENPADDEMIVTIYPLKITGATYKERKNNLESIAIDFSHADNGNNGMDELQIIYNFFEKNARRYGLTKVFRENAII